MKTTDLGNCHIFRPSARNLFLYVFFSTTLLTLIVLSPLMWWRPRLASTIAILVVALDLAWSIVYVVFYVAYFTFKVYPNGIYGLDSWGQYQWQSWSDIDSVRRVNFLGLRYLRAYSFRWKHPLSIPITIAISDRFLNLVLEFAEPGNPLLIFARNQLGIRDEDSDDC